MHQMSFWTRQRRVNPPRRMGWCRLNTTFAIYVRRDEPGWYCQFHEISQAISGLKGKIAKRNRLIRNIRDQTAWELTPDDTPHRFK